MPPKLNVERKKISDLTPDPSNANAGTERGLSMLDDSLSVVGLGRSIVTDKNGIIIGGNKTTERALDRGFENAIVVHTQGDELVVVQRDDLDLGANTPDNPARKLAYYDNRVAQVDLQWDAEQLLADVNAGFDFEHLFSEGELAALLADVQQPDVGEDPGAQVDRAAELQQKWQTERGQLWQIGKHRLLCGDSTSADDVARLMDGERADAVVTDPPYGMDLDTDWGDRVGTWERNVKSYAPVQNDDRPFDRAEVAVEAKEEFWFGADYYVDTLPDFGKQGSWFVWDKRQEGALDEMRGNAFELCWSKQRHKRELIRIAWVGVLGHNKKDDGDVKFHPTQKPVKLLKWLVEEFTDASGVVVDPFGGSGTTMVACEQLSRQCRMMELEPKYCAVILERMVGMGIAPELVTQ